MGWLSTFIATVVIAVDAPKKPPSFLLSAEIQVKRDSYWTAIFCLLLSHIFNFVPSFRFLFSSARFSASFHKKKCMSWHFGVACIGIPYVMFIYGTRYMYRIVSYCKTIRHHMTHTHTPFGSFNGLARTHVICWWLFTSYNLNADIIFQSPAKMFNTKLVYSLTRFVSLSFARAFFCCSLASVLAKHIYLIYIERYKRLLLDYDREQIDLSVLFVCICAVYVPAWNGNGVSTQKPIKVLSLVKVMKRLDGFYKEHSFFHTHS